MNVKTKVSAISLIAITLLSIVSVVNRVGNVTAATQFNKSSSYGRVLLLTNRDPKTQSPVAVSLGLDDRINLTIFGMEDDGLGKIQTFAKNLSFYDVVVCDSYLPVNETDQIWLRDQILDNDVGLLFFGGNYTMGLNVFDELIPAYFNINKNTLNETVADLFFGSTRGANSVVNDYLTMVYNNTKEFEIMQDQIQVAVSKEDLATTGGSQTSFFSKSSDTQTGKSIFTKNIAWQSCPMLRERVFTYARKDNTHTLVEVPNTQEPLVVFGNFTSFMNTTAKSSVIFISVSIGNMTFYTDKGAESKARNVPFTLWPYFNYLMYMCVFYLDQNFDKTNIESYADWPWSPIPHEREAAIWMTFVASLWIFNFVLFFTLGRKKKAQDRAAAVEKQNGAPVQQENAHSSDSKGIESKPDSTTTEEKKE